MGEEAAVESTDPVPTASDLLVEDWIVSWFHNLGLPTETQNRIRQAADDLKARLAGRKE